MASRVIPVEPFDLVIFGGTGDLARRKIWPALFRRFVAGQIEGDVRLIGAARSEMDSAAFRDFVAEVIGEFGGVESGRTDDLSSFLKMLHYVTLDARGDQGWVELSGLIRRDRIRAFYFSVAPSLFGDLAKRLHAHGMADDTSRIVVEKPFGRDLETSRDLNRVLALHFDECQ
ncbi:MAG: glucose-6-phosphate dehydrogenase, partial [Roseovarius sp.]|nr:glucose-6-phosphate dehydrogenase [Roseovarius sp.]